MDVHTNLGTTDSMEICEIHSQNGGWGQEFFFFEGGIVEKILGRQDQSVIKNRGSFGWPSLYRL